MGLGRQRSKTKRQNDESLQPPPFVTMDLPTKAKLGTIRRRIPRYLFWAWKNTRPRISGGFTTLITTEAIVPLAFRAGRGHASVYDMTGSSMPDMVLKHPNYRKDFFTEFSSWTASLAFAMLFFGNDTTDVHISVVDTQALRHSNEIFFVPELTVLVDSAMEHKKLRMIEKELKDMHHEYLIHGPVRSSLHRVVPLEHLISACLDLRSLGMPGAEIKQHSPKQITATDVTGARQVPEAYGFHLATPVALALVSLQERPPELFLRDDSTDLQQVLAGIVRLHVLQRWSNDDTIMDDVAYSGNYIEISQFIHLMRAIVRHDARNRAETAARVNQNAGFPEPKSRINHNLDSSNDDVSEAKSNQKQQAKLGFTQAPKRKWFIRFAKGQASLVRRPSQQALQRHVTRSVARVVKTPRSRRLLKIDTAELSRAMKKLEIDMNRHGKKENGGKNERDDIEMGDG